MSTVLVTGANRGIGLELCRLFRRRGDEVIAVCRNRSADLDVLDVRVVDGIDVTCIESLEALVGRLKGNSLDILVNNAGILNRDVLVDYKPEDIERQFRVNALGPLQTTRALLPLLASGSRVAIITSRMGSIEDNTSGAYYGYRMSKAAVNMAGKCLAIDLHERGIAVALLHPGMVSTDMTDHNGVPVETAAAGLIARVDELDLESSGGFWHAEGYRLPW